uniref:Uncharacterized protein n=1 Tax=Avena sativa TaxID=4498 RepID=A0ACD5TQU9_AVESA
MEPRDVELLERIFDGSIQPRDVKLSALESITENFSEERIIGEGGFATVYKGTLRNGEVAVKRIKSNHTIHENVFRREVNSLLNVSHKNIVRFLGFCSHTEHKVFENGGPRDHIFAENRERILCFEYIDQGSLENFIADELRGLHWDARYLIIKGICEGLQYLHMKKKIIHRDLKPANILIDHNMVAKITDFGLSRMEENVKTKSTTRVCSLGYTAPEYIDKGDMSVKYDVYSLGIIIIELVTGHRSIPDINNVLRRWMHRLRKSGEETIVRYQQIVKLVEIGLLCQEKDAYKRPFMSDIVHFIDELEGTDRQISNMNKSMVGQITGAAECTLTQTNLYRKRKFCILEDQKKEISAYLEDDMLGIEPLELRFPSKLNIQISRSLELTNKTNSFIAFSIQTTSPLTYSIEPNKGIVDPRSKYSVNITLHPLEKEPHDNYTGDFVVRSTKVNDNLRSKDISEDIFDRKDGKLVDEVNLTVTCKPEVPQVDMPLGPPIISDTRILQGPHESSVLPKETESQISASTTDEVIQLDPPTLYFPLVQDKDVLSSFKVINNTEYYVSIRLTYYSAETFGKYRVDDSASVLPPWTTRSVTVVREKSQDVIKDMQFNDEFLVWYAIAAADIKACDLNPGDYKECKKLPIVLTKINYCTSSELIQFDPPELSFPCLNKTSVSTVNITNITDCYIGFNTWCFENYAAWYEKEPGQAILPPQSSRRMVVKRVPKEKEPEDMQWESKIFVWNMIVAEGVKSSDLCDYFCEEESKELPLTFKEVSPCITSDELIRLDNPRLQFTLSQNKTSLSSLNMVNITDYYIGFRLFNGLKNAVSYYTDPKLGILAPQSSQRLVVARPTNKKEPAEDTLDNDSKLFMWNAIVNEGVEASDLDCRMSLKIKQSNELPMILNKVISSTSVELIKFEPPELSFPFLPSKSLFSSIKIVNITDYRIAFIVRVATENVAVYTSKPSCGILTPWSTQEVVVKRVAKEEAKELEDMQCKDKLFVWSGFVTEDVNASDLAKWSRPIGERKELPIVFTEKSSNELIQFDPPELCLPLLPGQGVLSSANIVNITDQYIGFRICTKKSNTARYNANPSEGILPPFSTQVLLVTTIAEGKELEDTQCTDKFLVWNGIVTKDVKASHVIDNMSEIKCTELPIFLTKTSASTSDELIQFDPPELHFPFLPNKKVMSSIKIENSTDYNVGFNAYSGPTNVAWYHTEPPRGILPPRSTQKLMVTREQKEDVLEDEHFDDKYYVWKGIVCGGVKESDLSDYMADQESKELPIVLDKIRSLTSDELILLDPAELCMPHWPSKKIMFRVNIVNNTDFYVAFHVYTITRNEVRYKESQKEGILRPQSTERCILNWIIDDMEPVEDYFVWNRVVTEGVESSDITSYMVEEESKKLPFVLNKESPCTCSELIQVDPTEISLPFILNKQLVFTLNIVNNTDYCIGFSAYGPERNVGKYYGEPGVMPPRSTHRLVVRSIPQRKEHEDMQCEDKFFIWSCLVSEGVEASDIDPFDTFQGDKELRIVYNKTRLCTSDELIQFDPPQLSFPFLPNKRVSMFRFFKIFNVTDHNVGFSIWSDTSSPALYGIEPDEGIIPPESTQIIKVRRTLKETETEDMQCKDKISVWNGIVTEGVQVSDVGPYSDEENKKLPIVLTKPGGSSSR